MLYVSFDIETTANDWRYGEIVEFGAVVDDLKNPKPVGELPTFHTYVLPMAGREEFEGQEFALNMNKDIIERIYAREEGYEYTKPEDLAKKFRAWLLSLGRQFYVNKHTGKVHFTPAGKNMGSFDQQWVTHLLGFDHEVVMYAPAADPAVFYYRPGDKKLPNAQICMERAGMAGLVAHTAVEDSIMVIEMLRQNMIDGYEIPKLEPVGVGASELDDLEELD